MKFLWIWCGSNLYLYCMFCIYELTTWTQLYWRGISCKTLIDFVEGSDLFIWGAQTKFELTVASCSRRILWQSYRNANNWFDYFESWDSELLGSKGAISGPNAADIWQNSAWSLQDRSRESLEISCQGMEDLRRWEDLRGSDALSTTPCCTTFVLSREYWGTSVALHEFSSSIPMLLMI